eukprot:29200_1
MSTERNRYPKWNKSLSFPIRSTLSQPFMVNNDEFVVVASKADYYCGVSGDGIYKFNTQKNEWTKIFDYDKNFQCDIYSATYDNKEKLLYICDTSSRMLSFDLKTKKTLIRYTGGNESFELIFAENALHQICHTGNHYIYNTTKQLQKITTFNSLKNLGFYGVIYVKRNKSILLFGGWNILGWNMCNTFNTIYQFSFIDSKWEELNIKIPIKLFAFGLVATKNEQYIIIFGGATDASFSDDIFIYNVRKNIFTKSKMKCPKKGSYHAITINNSKHDEIATFGFVNGCYKAANFVGVQILPHYLIKIIGCYFCHEEIHLLRRDSGEHWEINVDHILQQ